MTIAVGDFNGDGFQDVAVGESAPSGGVYDVGAVYVYDGGRDGVSTTPTMLPGPTGQPLYTPTLASGDINGDGYDDLVVGYPGARIGHQGYVTTYYGSQAGLSAADSTQTMDTHVTTQGERTFGEAIAVADVNGDGYDDVVVGEPEVHTQKGAPASNIQVFDGTSHGLSSGRTIIDASQVHGGKSFGATLAAGQLDGHHGADVAVGAPEDRSSRLTASGHIVQLSGRVVILSGGSHGLRVAHPQVITPASPLPRVVPEVKYLGDALAIGRVLGGSHADLVVGAPPLNGTSGAIYVLPAAGRGVNVSAAVGITQRSVGVRGHAAASAFFGWPFSLLIRKGTSQRTLAIGSFNFRGHTHVNGAVFLVHESHGRLRLHRELLGPANSRYYGYALAS
jgi:hypothetical protein